MLGLITAFLVFAAGVATTGYGTIDSWRGYQRSQLRGGEYRKIIEEAQQKLKEYQQTEDWLLQWVIWFEQKAEDSRQWGTIFYEAGVVVDRLTQEDETDWSDPQQWENMLQEVALKYTYKAEGAESVIIFSSITGLLLSFAVTCILIFRDYLMRRKTFFQIQYAGGCIAFNVSYYAKAEIDDFQKQLRRAKDLAEESASKAPVLEAPVQPAAAAQNSVPDDLQKYADLLKEGLISQEEYDAMKKKILGL
ncbi:MAG: SHOCT domain-containing protein [Roseburia sp.]|nr:SHOCT domain-containing protein [Roseburia sp.]MCM1097456.1 SHOCT domain-containing protein [Ruminococcus flavefaciens]